MSDTEENQNTSNDETVAPDSLEENRKGRPAGKVDQKPRYRRTAEQISADKIKIAEMKLNTLREVEERKLASKKTRRKAPRIAVAETAIPPAPAKKKACAAKPVNSPPPSPKCRTFGRQALYDSWFPSSPRTRY